MNVVLMDISLIRKMRMNMEDIKYLIGAEIKKNNMKDNYSVKSNRYGHTHQFVKIEDSENYFFKPEKDWMPLYITYNSDKSGIKFIDTEGGPILGKGWFNDEIKIVDILLTDNGILFKLEENVLEEKRNK